MKRIICLILSAVVLLSLVPYLAPAAAAETVTADALNIRAEPNTTSTVVGFLNRGDQVTILETKEVDGYTWGRIDRGWIRLDYTDYVAPTGPSEPSDSEDQTPPDNGWAKRGGKWYYYVNGTPKTNWMQLDNKWYYFGSDGAMQTGLVQIDGKWYYFNADGIMQTGWVKVGAKHYYFKPSGHAATGWLELGGKWYYLYDDGSMAVGKIRLDDGVHKFNAEGVWQGRSNYFLSDECMRIIKAEEGFSKYPYWDYAQWTVGYGTKCPDDMLDTYKTNGITVDEAEILLRVHMLGTENSIEAYIERYDLTLTQGQYDALVSFSYNCGTGWAYDTTDTLHNAVKNGATGNDIIRAFGLWCNAGGSFLQPLMRRRLCESNMYLNGVYSTTPPSNYCYVRYDANGGSTRPRVQAFDSNVATSIITTPTYEGYTFQGWYTEKEGGTKVTALTAALNTKTLYARWSQGSGSSTPDPEEPKDEPQDDQNNNNNTAITAGVSITVTADGVNLRVGPGTNYGYVSGKSTANTGDSFTIVETASGSNLEWGRFTENGGGWICLKYTDFDSAKLNTSRAFWRQEGGKWYCFKGTSKLNGWNLIDNSWYYMDGTGARHTGWLQLSGKWYYMDGTGVMQTGWVYHLGKWYFTNSSGVMRTGWIQEGKNWYYLNKDGVMQTGWQLLGGKWYYLKASGVMQTGWLKYNGWYYLNKDGVMQTGWLQQGNVWYYLGSSGAMATGKQTIGGKEYNFSGDGVWIQ